MTSESFEVEIKPEGIPISVPGVRINAATYIVTGGWLRTASLRYEWQEDVIDPEMTIRELKKSPVRVDLLKFWQRIPDQEVKYPYYNERREVAAIPITTFQHWWDKQIRFKARNKMRKAEKLEVIIEEATFDDNLVRGVMGIYNQSPIRRGKPFRHFGKDFETVKGELAIDLDKAVFVAAYYKSELVGFVKFQVDDRYARITLILDKIVHRDKSPTNGMIAKVVEICASRGIPFLTYYLWRRGDHGKFQASVGFEKISVPQYYIPLTLIGQLALYLRLHEGLKNVLPESSVSRLLSLRARCYGALTAARRPFSSAECASKTKHELSETAELLGARHVPVQLFQRDFEATSPHR